jgi:hypothetical protein
MARHGPTYNNRAWRLCERVITLQVLLEDDGGSAERTTANMGGRGYLGRVSFGRRWSWPTSRAW